jgi:hypothetical protein
MLSSLRENFGFPGAIATAALVFAMIGGAYAAADSGGAKATASTKGKRGPKGPKGPKGDTGPAGPQGPAGPAGAAGKDGADGLDGLDGPTGPTGATGATGKGATGSTGPTGSIDFGATLPPGETEIGAWGGAFVPVAEEENGEVVRKISVYGDTISFPVPLGAVIDELHQRFIPLGETPPASCDDEEGESPSAENPEADPGYLCVFVGKDSGEDAPITFIYKPDNSETPGAARTGFSILAGSVFEELKYWSGTFAVTAPVAS